jgi:hypothetical protein
LRELYKYLTLVVNINKKYWNDWTGIKMDQGRIAEKVFESKPEGSRRSGRPRLRRLKDVEKYLLETKVKRLRQKAEDREEWEAVI